jgi:uncharacterized membrane protein YedE/YeeE
MIETLFPNGVEAYVLGGLLVGIGIAIPFIATGLVAGASTVFTSTWSYVLAGSFFNEPTFRTTRHWRLALSAGLITGGFLFIMTLGVGETYSTTIEWWRLLIGGIIIGIGTRMSGGCASGHGVIGNAALERTSLVSTITFLLIAIATAQLTQLFF